MTEECEMYQEYSDNYYQLFIKELYRKKNTYYYSNKYNRSWGKGRKNYSGNAYASDEWDSVYLDIGFI